MQIPRVGQILAPVRPMAKNDVAAFAAGARRDLSIIGQVTDTAMQAATAFGKAQKEAYRLKIENQQSIASAETAREARKLERELASREFYSPDEIPEGLNVRTTEKMVDTNGDVIEIPRDQIPAHEVNPHLFRKGFEAYISASADGIEDAEAREMWSRRMKGIKDEASHKMEMAAIEDQQEELRNINITNIGEALDDRSYDVALGLAGSSVFGSHQQEVLKKEILNRQEKDTYDASLSESDLPAMVDHLQKLRDPEYNENLNEAERLTYINRLGSGIVGAQEAKETDNTVEFQRLRRAVDRTVKSVNSGNIPDQDQLTDLAERVSAAARLDPNQMVQYEDKLRETIGYMPEMAQFVRMNDIQRQEALASMPGGTGGEVGFNEAHKLSIFQSADKNIARRIDDDVFSLGRDVGLVDSEPMPSLADREEFIDWLSLRQRGYDNLESRYGVGAHLSNAEKDLVSNSLRTMTSFEKLELMGTVFESLDQDTPTFWQQFDDVSGGIFTVAGALYGDDPRTARTIIEGQEFKNSDNYNPPPAIDVNDARSRLIQHAYAIGSHREAVAHSVDAAYAYLSREAGEYDAGGAGFSNSRYEDALEMVTGGLISMGGNKIAPPVRGMQSGEFSSWVRDIDDSWIQEQGGVRGYVGRYDEFRDDLRNGNIRMMAVGENEYLLRSEIGGVDTFLLDESEQPFVFSYDPDASTTYRGIWRDPTKKFTGRKK